MAWVEIESASSSLRLLLKISGSSIAADMPPSAPRPVPAPNPAPASARSQSGVPEFGLVVVVVLLVLFADVAAGAAVVSGANGCAPPLDGVCGVTEVSGTAISASGRLPLILLYGATGFGPVACVNSSASSCG